MHVVWVRIKFGAVGVLYISVWGHWWALNMLRDGYLALRYIEKNSEKHSNLKGLRSTLWGVAWQLRWL